MIQLYIYIYIYIYIYCFYIHFYCSLLYNIEYSFQCYAEESYCLSLLFFEHFILYWNIAN